MEISYKIEFVNGTIDVDYSGCFIVNDPLPASLTSDLSVVKIHQITTTDDGNNLEHVDTLTDQRLIVHDSYDGRYWFSFAPAIPIVTAIVTISGTSYNTVVNGDTYQFDQEIHEAIYPLVTIEKEGIKEELHYARVQRAAPYNEYNYVIFEVSGNELKMQKMASDIEYLSMMSDIEL